MDNKSRATRFLIDKIDSKLGSVEKELKFDKIVIGVSVALLVVFVIILALCSKGHAVLSIISILMIIFSASLAIYMTKEYFDDRQKL